MRNISEEGRSKANFCLCTRMANKMLFELMASIKCTLHRWWHDSLMLHKACRAGRLVSWSAGTTVVADKFMAVIEGFIDAAPWLNYFICR